MVKSGNICFVLSVKNFEDGFKQIQDEIIRECNSGEETG